jgi:adenylate kinase family enzyme
MKNNKILIVGGIGSGKTTLANKLSKKLNIKSYELDNIAYKRRDVHQKREPQTRDKKLKSILKRKKWIIEGFYSRPWTYPIYKQGDIIIILNIKLTLAKKRVIIRFLKRKFLLKKNKKINKNFKTMLRLLKYVKKEEYNEKLNSINKITKKLSKKYIILENKKQINKFLNKIK